MEIILSLMFVVTPLLVALLSLGSAMDKPTRKRLYKVARAHWAPKFKRKSLAPSIIPEGLVKLEPRNKDWGPDGKLTQLWQDAFDYWQLSDPKGVLESYRNKSHELEQRRTGLEKSAKWADIIYERYFNSRGGVSVSQAVEAKRLAREARMQLRTMVREPYYTPEERVAKRLAERYGTEVFYNNDLVRLSSQKQMPTFDYIALTSV